MDAHKLKEYIYENDYIEHILEKLECHSIKSYTTEYRATLPCNSKSNNNIAIKKNEHLSTKIFTSKEIIRGDIITLVIHIKNYSFIKALKYLHQILNLQFTFVYDEKEKEKEIYDPLHIFKRIKKTYHQNSEVQLKKYDKSILNQYINVPHINFLRDGISIKTQNKFSISYCPDKSRIVIPHFYWSSGDLVGIIGRTTIENYDLFDIAKYYPLIPYPKSQNLYGLNMNYQGIQESGIVVVFESEKSTLKADTYGYNNTVSVGCHEISEEQRRILIGLNVEIVIAWDKDVPLEHTLNTCEMFKGIRKVSYIYDKYDILDEKMSPIDKSKKIYDYLLKHRVNYYDIKERGAIG